MSKMISTIEDDVDWEGWTSGSSEVAESLAG